MGFCFLRSVNPRSQKRDLGHPVRLVGCLLSHPFAKSANGWGTRQFCGEAEWGFVFLRSFNPRSQKRDPGHPVRLVGCMLSHPFAKSANGWAPGNFAAKRYGVLSFRDRSIPGLKSETWGTPFGWSGACYPTHSQRARMDGAPGNLFRLKKSANGIERRTRGLQSRWKTSWRGNMFWSALPVDSKKGAISVCQRALMGSSCMRALARAKSSVSR